jgi:two-component system, sensor histidine kinase
MEAYETNHTANEISAPPCVRRVLLVDDHVGTAELLGQIFLLKGYEPVLASNGRDALDAAARTQPGVILLDMSLPDIHGHEICRRIRAELWGRDALIIGLSGWEGERSIDEAIEAGCDHYLVKPVRFDTLEALLHEA